MKRNFSAFLFLGLAILSGILAAVYENFQDWTTTPTWVGTLQGGIVKPLSSLSEPAFALSSVLLLLRANIPNWLRVTARVVSLAFVGCYLVVFLLSLLNGESRIFYELLWAFTINTRFLLFTFSGIPISLACYPKKI